MKMNIMISINRAYIQYACVMLMSLKQHHKGILLSVYILHNDLSEEDFEQMDAVIGSDGIELIPVLIPKGTTKEFQIGEWEEVCAFRLLVVELFAGTLDRILHLDVDILITGDISEFYNTPFEGNYLVACEDFIPDEVRRRKAKEIGRDENVPVFNSGVLLFNIEKLSKDGFCYAFYADIMTKYPAIRIEYPDQDMLNLLFCDKTKYMDPIKYNYMPYYYEVQDREHYYNTPDELEQNCCIIHMARATKPWENIFQGAADELWWMYAKRTPFYLDMKIKHIHALIHKRNKISALLDKTLQDALQGIDNPDKVLRLEKVLLDILKYEIGVSEEVEKHIL